MVKLVQFGIDVQLGSDIGFIKADISFQNEKRFKLYEKKLDGIFLGFDKENMNFGSRGLFYLKEGIRRQLSLDIGSIQYSRGRYNEQYALVSEDGDKLREYGSERGRNRDRFFVFRRYYSEIRLLEIDRRFV